MNGNKIRKEDSEKDLQVESINKDSATFVYKINDIAKQITNLAAKTKMEHLKMVGILYLKMGI